MLLLLSLTTIPLSSQMVYPKAMPKATMDGTFVADQWAYDLACTGLTPQPGGQLKDVIWFVGSNESMSVGHVVLHGLWVHPNIIYINEIDVHNEWVVRHELLHHLLRGPPLDQGGPHPWAPFAFPCQVMPFQHVSGGLMGANSGGH